MKGCKMKDKFEDDLTYYTIESVDHSTTWAVHLLLRRVLGKDTYRVYRSKKPDVDAYIDFWATEDEMEYIDKKLKEAEETMLDQAYEDLVSEFS